MAALACLAVSATACQLSPSAESDAAAASADNGGLTFLDSPAAPGSGEPNLFTAADGGVYLSWIEPAGDDRHAIRFARLDGNTWSMAGTIAQSDAFFVNWADFPSIIATNGGQLVAHWLEKSGPDTYAYGVKISRSLDGGESWSEPEEPHHDGTQTEHGFVSLVPETDGGFTAIWLDGRDFAGFDRRNRDTVAEGPEMTLRGSRFGADGVQGLEVLLDSRICECCQTSAAYVGDTLLVAYRDRSEDEVRDIWSVRRTPEGWQEPVRLAYDDWQIPGCPVNGPAVAGGEDVAAVAWFSLREGIPEVKVTFTTDGVSYTDPVLLDGGDGEIDRPASEGNRQHREGVVAPLGRVGVAWIGDKRAVVSWLRARGGSAEIMLRTVDVEGALGREHNLATTSSARASGFPRIVRNGDRLVLAWTEPGHPSRLHTAVVPLPLD